MEKPSYNTESSTEGLLYVFVSKNQDKNIKKAIAYLPLNQSSDICELIFGDVKEDATIDVQAISNNQDMPIVLNTVIDTLHQFFELYPSKTVIFTGSSESRNRLYRAVISKTISEASKKFDIFGVTFDDKIERFVENKNYFAFQICLKS